MTTRVLLLLFLVGIAMGFWMWQPQAVGVYALGLWIVYFVRRRRRREGTHGTR